MGQMIQFSPLKFLELLVEIFWSVRVGRKKCHNYSRVLLHEVHTKNGALNSTKPNFLSDCYYEIFERPMYVP